MFDANPKIVETLRERGRLLHFETYHHSYPHCWRHKTPVIFRATPQWFLSMEKAGLRRDALTAIRSVRWIPGWGEQRITSMIETRPDWCISRQRTWGVPLALFMHKETGEPHPQTPELLEQVAELVAEGGIEAWFALNPRHLLGDEALVYEKCEDVMDVWLDSGVVHHCLPALRPGLIPFPADLYLEGSDQHRGWFHSSLLTSVAGRGVAPYRQVLTHGFTVDEKGRKMSKSLGNVVAPQKVVQSLGADVLRLWVAATDYSGEISDSDEILKRMSDSYRRMRNTVRFLLGNLAGFDPARDALPVDEMVALDRWALARAASLQEEIIEAYRELRVPLDLPEGAQLLRRRAGRVLARHPQGPPVHDAGEERRAPLRADGDVPHRRGDGALARADPVVHGRGDLELPAGRARRIGVPQHLVETARRREVGCRGLGRRDRAEDRRLARARAAARRRRARRAARGRGGRLSRRGAASAHGRARRRTALRADHLAGEDAARGGAPGDGRRGRIARERGRLALGRGGSGAQVRALLAPARGRRPGPEHPEICARCVTNLDGPGEARRFA